MDLHDLLNLVSGKFVSSGRNLDHFFHVFLDFFVLRLDANLCSFPLEIVVSVSAGRSGHKGQGRGSLGTRADP